MFLISKSTLPILEIADYWSREICRPAKPAELYKLLEGAWWRGEIVGDAPVSRFQLLKLFIAGCGGQDFVFATASGASCMELPNGSASYDLATVWVSSNDTSDWTETNCTPAFEGLAQASMSAQWSAPALAAINLSFDQFMGYIAKQGYAAPTFWRRAGHATSRRIGGPQSKIPEIRDAARKLFAQGRVPEKLGWKQMHKEICQAIGVAPTTRGFGLAEGSMSNIGSRTEPKTHERFQIRLLLILLLRKSHLSEFFSRLLEEHSAKRSTSQVRYERTLWFDITEVFDANEKRLSGYSS